MQRKQDFRKLQHWRSVSLRHRSDLCVRSCPGRRDNSVDRM